MQIVIGLGTGRCGTESLAYFLNLQDKSAVHHEKHRHEISWQGAEREIERFLDWCESATNLKLVGDVAFYYLPYVEYMLSINPRIKFVCLQRPRKDTVASYVRWTKGKNHWLSHNGTTWSLDVWDQCYPKYDVLNKREAIGLYWDEYSSSASELEVKYPDSFGVFSVETLNIESGQREILSFLGIPREEHYLKVGIHLGSCPSFLSTVFTRFRQTKDLFR